MMTTFTLDEAFALLHDSVRYALLDAQHAGADAFRTGDFTAALERARQLQALDAQIGALEAEVARLLLEHESTEPLPLPGEAPAPRPVYRRGGSNDDNSVLDLLYAKMAPVLSDYYPTALPTGGVTRASAIPRSGRATACASKS